MGSFYNSVHVHTEAYDLVRNILTQLAKEHGYKFYLAPVINGWISFFPNNFDCNTIILDVSKQTTTDVLQLMVYDDDVFCYSYYRSGELLDEFNSWPDYFGETVSAVERKRLKGKPEIFKRLIGNQRQIKEISKILRSRPSIQKMQIPEEIKNVDKNLKSLSKKVQKFASSPDAIQAFLTKHPGLLKNDCDSLTQELASKGIKSETDIQEFLIKSGKAYDMALKLTEEFRKSCMNSGDFAFLDPNSDEAKKINKATEQMYNEFAKGNEMKMEVFFSSNTMYQFAEILGISNSLTSYEYLKAGETDNIKEWDKFVEISHEKL